METVVDYFEIIYLHLTPGTEEGHEKPQSVQFVVLSIFEKRTLRKEARKFTV
jgi:hypothetical protein